MRMSSLEISSFCCVSLDFLFILIDHLHTFLIIIYESVIISTYDLDEFFIIKKKSCTFQNKTYSYIVFRSIDYH